MRRDPLPWVLLLALVLAGAVAWLTRHPDSPILDRMAEWPLVGPAAERFRAIYRPPAPAPPAAEPGVEVEVVGRATAPPRDAPSTVTRASPRRRLWIRPGTELRESPDPRSAVRFTLPAFTRMELIERRDGWLRLSGATADGPAMGWAWVAEVPEPSLEELWRPAPVLPLPATPPDAELLELARELMGAAAREAACGPYRLITDVGRPEVLERCARLGAELDAVYSRRYGLRPAGEPAEAILIFRTFGAYLRFRARAAPEGRQFAFAAPADGIVALCAEGKPDAEIQASLAHELTHLLNRRFLGPALPPWLEEGVAEELAMSRFEADGALVPGSLGRWRSSGGRRWVEGGGQVVLGRLRGGLARRALPTPEELVGLDRTAFQAQHGLQTRYSLSGFWVRYLLSSEAPAGGDGFRSFLAAVAAGERLDEELLLTSLGAGWDELGRGFSEWLAGYGEKSG